jgi:prepilin-type N-terminal cleavage/methylation domain-containing protein
MRTSPHRRAGFTLLEMMTVVAIVGVMSAMAVFGLGTVAEQGGVSGETRKLVTRLQSARALAVSTGRPHGVYIGGPIDAALPAFSNHVVLFSKPVGAVTNNFVPGADTVVVSEQIGKAPNTPIQLDLLDGANRDKNVIIVFDPATGRAGLTAAPVPPFMRVAGVDVPFPAGNLPLFLQYRDTRRDPAASNPSRRRVQVLRSGAARVAQADF